MEFMEFPKMARLTRECVITEKIDGTNAQIGIRELAEGEEVPLDTPYVAVVGRKLIYAGSRSRWLYPNPGVTIGREKFTDNFGFAQWVEKHADELATLPEGRHFGEWWGQGIQRGYGLTEKRFSLFNTLRFCLHGTEPQPINEADPRNVKMQHVLPPCVGLVPVLYRGLFGPKHDENFIAKLRAEGSVAVPGYMKPEGIVIYHVAAGVGFKKTLEKDEQPKGFGG